MNAFAFLDSLFSEARTLLLGKLRRCPRPRDRQGLAADEAAMHRAIAGCVSDILLRQHPELFFDRPGQETSEPDVLSITVADHASRAPLTAGQRLRVPGNREFPDYYRPVSADYRLYPIRFSAPPSLKPRDPELLYAVVGTLLDTAHRWFRARLERLFFGGERFSLMPALDSTVRPYFNDETLLSQLQFIIDTPAASFYCFNEERLDTPLRNIAQHFPGVSPELLLAEVAGHLMPAGQKFSGLVDSRQESLVLDLPYVRYRLPDLGRYPEAEIALFLSPAVTLFNLCETPGYNLRVTVPSRYTNAFRCFKQPLLRKYLTNVFQTKTHRRQILSHIRDLQEHRTLLPDFSAEEVPGRSRPGPQRSPAKRSTVFLSRSLTSTAGALVQALLFEADTLPDAERLTETRREGRTDFDLFLPPLLPPEDPRQPPLEEPDQAAEIERLRTENEYLLEENRHLQKENRCLGAENFEFQKTVDQLRAKQNSFIRRLNRLETDNRGLRDKYTAALARIDELTPLETTVRELQEQCNALMERIAEPAVSQQGEAMPEQTGELPQEIVEALKAWPESRQTKETAEDYVLRIFFDHYGHSIYDPSIHPTLRLTELKDINSSLYWTLRSSKTRKGKNSKYPSCISTKRDALTREIESVAFSGGYGNLPYRDALRLKAAASRRKRPS